MKMGLAVEVALPVGLTITPADFGPVNIPMQAARFVRRGVGGLIIDKEQQQGLKGPPYALDISYRDY